MSPRIGLGVRERRKYLASERYRTPGRPAHSLVTMPTDLSRPPKCKLCERYVIIQVPKLLGYFNPLALELDINSLAHHLRKM